MANQKLKRKLVEYISENGKGELTWIELYDKFPFRGKKITKDQKGDSARKAFDNAIKRQNREALSKEIDVNGFELNSMWGNMENPQVSYKRSKGKINTEDLQEIINNLDFKVPPRHTKQLKEKGSQILAWTDQHVGMDAVGNIFKKEWTLKKCYANADELIRKAKKGTHVYLPCLGDFTDGLGGKTARGGHSLPQNMNDKEMFKNGLELLLYVIEGIAKKSNLTVYFLTNSNHPNVTDYNIGLAAQKIVELRHDNVTFHNCEDFITHAAIEGKDYLFSHGYDEGLMSRGFPRFLTGPHIEKIKNYIMFHKLDYPTLMRGDLHQFTDIDYEHFRDIIVPAFSSPSGWISINFFSNNHGGFVEGDFSDPDGVAYKFVRFQEAA